MEGSHHSRRQKFGTVFQPKPNQQFNELYAMIHSCTSMWILCGMMFVYYCKRLIPKVVTKKTTYLSNVLCQETTTEKSEFSIKNTFHRFRFSFNLLGNQLISISVYNIVHIYSIQYIYSIHIVRPHIY